MEGVFDYLGDFQVLICIEHKRAISKERVERHLMVEHQGIPLEIRRQIVKHAQELAIASPAEVKQPKAPIPPFSQLQKPAAAFKCEDEKGCNCVLRDYNKMRQHASNVHGWVGTKLERDGPWRVIETQSFYVMKGDQQLFEVQDQLKLSGIAGAPEEHSHEALKAQTLALFNQLLKAQELASESVQQPLHITEETPWTRRSGYREHLLGYPLDDLREAISLPKGKEEEPALFAICESLEGLLRQAHVAAGNERGKRRLNDRNARILNSFQRDRQNPRPFRALQNDKTVNVYLGTWKRFLCYVCRISLGYTGTLAERKPFQLTKDQETHLHSAVECTQAFGIEEEVRKQQLDEHVQKLCIAFIRQPCVWDPFESPLLSFSAALCLSVQPSGPLDARHFSPYLSHIIYCIQLLTLLHCITKAERKKIKEPFTQYLKSFHDQWLSNESEGPMGEILSQRLYAMSIGESTVAPVDTRWDESGRAITYRETTIRMEEITQLLQDQINAANAILSDELLLGFTPPLIESSQLRDNWSNKMSGFSFIHDRRNDLAVKAPWLLERLLSSQQTLEAFTEVGADNGTLQWRSRKAWMYEHSVQLFLEHLLVLVHVSAGQPGRGPEILGTRFANTTLVRNLLLHDGLIMVAIPYHKSQSKTDASR